MIFDAREMLATWWPLLPGLALVFGLGLLVGRRSKTGPAYRKGRADMEKLIRDGVVKDLRARL